MKTLFSILILTISFFIHNISQAAVGIAIRTDSTCAIMERENNKLYCWGSNDQCQTGSFCTGITNNPTAKSGLTSGVSAVTKYNWGTCVIHNGAVKCWGDNTFGQRGKDPAVFGDGATPSAISGLSTQVTQVIGGYEHICAMTTVGDVRCWGVNTYGQLGDGTFNNIRWIPVTAIASGATKVAPGGSTTCALMNNGTVKCWGLHHGNTLPAGEVLTPTTVSGLTNVTDIAAGDSHFCVVYNGAVSGMIKCWGNNAYGQFGNNTTTSSKTPVDVVGYINGGANKVYGGLSFSCATKLNANNVNKLHCWGRNNRGQLGDGTSIDRLVSGPVHVVDHNTYVNLGNENICNLWQPYLQNYFMYNCWGDNSHKQLGKNIYGEAPNPSEDVFVFDFWGGPY